MSPLTSHTWRRLRPDELDQDIFSERVRLSAFRLKLNNEQLAEKANTVWQSVGATGHPWQSSWTAFDFLDYKGERQKPTSTVALAVVSLALEVAYEYLTGEAEHYPEPQRYEAVMATKEKYK